MLADMAHRRRHFAGDVQPMGDVLGRAAAGDFAAMYLVGGDPEGWITDAQAAALEKVDTVIVQDILPSAASRLRREGERERSSERESTDVNVLLNRPGGRIARLMWSAFAHVGHLTMLSNNASSREA